MPIADIFSYILNEFTYVSDLRHYGVPEKWAMPDLEEPIVGDCEDFALACRAMCRKHGYKSRLVFCKTETNEYHCVLEVNDEYILDNRATRPLHISELPYEFMAVSGYEAGEPWHVIAGAA